VICQACESAGFKQCNPGPDCIAFPRRARERKTGRYGFEGQRDRLCVCGHTLGQHTAEAPHSCIVGDFEEKGCETDCERFRPAKAKGESDSTERFGQAMNATNKRAPKTQGKGK
jgi:hypothetical protein